MDTAVTPAGYADGELVGRDQRAGARVTRCGSRVGKPAHHDENTPRLPSYAIFHQKNFACLPTGRFAANCCS